MSLTNSEKIIKAILNINADAEVTCGDNIDKITWHGNTTPISKADIQVELDKINAEESPDNYKHKRLGEYPHWLDCIHALLDGGDTLTELQEKRQAIKNKYPKD